jgi:anti-sigma regulatory factor (Ser/Thr protein kinase)
MTSARWTVPSLDESAQVEREDDPDPERRRPARERLAASASMAALERSERVSLSIPRDTHYLAIVRKLIADLGARAGFRGEDLDKIELAVDEACSNAMIYQVDPKGLARFDELKLEITIERSRFVVVLSDQGDRYEFDEQGNFDLEDHLRRMEPGGLGIYIIKNFMDEVAYEHSVRSGNVLTMVKYRPS